MRVLIACEFTGIIRDAFIAAGHDAVSCDLLPSEREGPHHQGDVRPLLRERWDLVIAHPPCTYLSLSGVSHLYVEPSAERWKLAFEAAMFFRECLEANAPRVCVENPVMHKYGVAWVGRNYDQIIQPYHHGHGETKRTGLWLRGLPVLLASDPVAGRDGRIGRMPARASRGHDRSRSYPGVGRAMASQWHDRAIRCTATNFRGIVAACCSEAVTR